MQHLLAERKPFSLSAAPRAHHSKVKCVHDVCSREPVSPELIQEAARDVWIDATWLYEASVHTRIVEPLAPADDLSCTAVWLVSQVSNLSRAVAVYFNGAPLVCPRSETAAHIPNSSARERDRAPAKAQVVSDDASL